MVRRRLNAVKMRIFMAVVACFASVGIDLAATASGVLKPALASEPDPDENPYASMFFLAAPDEYTRIYRFSDLSFIEDIYPYPVNFMGKDGKWHPSHPSILSMGDDTAPTNYFGTYAADTADAQPFLRFTQTGGNLDLALDNASSTGIHRTDTDVAYSGVYTDVDLKIHPIWFGTVQTFTLHSADVPNVFSFRVSEAAQYQVEQRGSQVRLYSQDHQLLYTFVPVSVTDATGKTIGAASIRFRKAGDETYIDTAVDPSVLQASSTVYPVAVKTGIIVGDKVQIATVDSTQPQIPIAGEVRSGTTSEAGIVRTYVKFGRSLPSLAGELFNYAKVYAHNESPDSSLPVNLAAIADNEMWNPVDTTWNHQPVVDESTAVADEAMTVRWKTGWTKWRVTDLVCEFADGRPYQGFCFSTPVGDATGTRGFDTPLTGQDIYLRINYSEPPDWSYETFQPGELNSSKADICLSWFPVAGATGYCVYIFNGKDYESFDVGNVTTWSTTGRNIWPTPSEIAAGRYELHHDGMGTVLADDPRPVYLNAGMPLTGTIEDATYRFYVTAYNDNGESGPSEVRELAAWDRTAPTTPGKPELVDPNPDHLTFAWAPSTDSYSGLNRYHVEVNVQLFSGQYLTEEVADVTTPSYTIRTPLYQQYPLASYYITVKAIDQEGNFSPKVASDVQVARPFVESRIVGWCMSPVESDIPVYNYVRIRNEGFNAWPANGEYHLGVKDSPDLFKDLVVTPDHTVSSGDEWKAEFRAPAQVPPGSYKLTFQMYRDHDGTREWFGEPLTLNVTVKDHVGPRWQNGHVEAHALSSTSVQLNWPDATDSNGVKSYNIYLGSQRIATVPGDTTTYTVTGLSPGIPYQFAVEAVDGEGNLSSRIGTDAPVETLPLPWAERAGLSVSPYVNTIEVDWSSDKYDGTVLSYRVYVNGVWKGTAAGDAEHYTITGLYPNTDYSVRVDVVTDRGVFEGPTVNTKTVKDSQGPWWEGDYKISAGNVTETGCVLHWSSAHDDDEVSSYLVFENGRQIGKTSASNNSFTVTGLVPGKAYKFSIAAVDRSGNVSSFHLETEVKTSISQLSGSVTKASHRMLTGVTVSIYTLNGHKVASTRTDRNGHYTLFVRSGTYTVKFTRPGYHTVTSRLTVGRNKKITVNVRMVAVRH